MYRPSPKSFLGTLSRRRERETDGLSFGRVVRVDNQRTEKVDGLLTPPNPTPETGGGAGGRPYDIRERR